MAEAKRNNNQESFTDSRASYIAPGKRTRFVENLNHEPEYPTISGDFNKRQYDPRGIQNVTTTVGERANQQNARVMRTTGNITQRAGRRIREYGQGLQTDASAKKAVTAAGKGIERLGKAVRVGSRLAVTGRGYNMAGARAQVAFTMGWTGLLNALSLTTGLAALAAFGMTAIVQSAISAIPGGQTIADWGAWLFGAADSSALWIVAIGLLALHWFLVVTMFSVAYLQLKLGGLQPISGKASGIKTVALVSSFLISMLPGANLIPWIFVWLFVVGKFPR